MSVSQVVQSFIIRSRYAVVALAAVVALSAGTPAHAQKEMNEFVNSAGQTIDLTPYKVGHPLKMRQEQGRLGEPFRVGKANAQEMLQIETLVHLHIAQLTWPVVDMRIDSRGDRTDSIEVRRRDTKARFLMRPLGTQEDNQAPDIHDKVNAMLVKGLQPIISDPEYSLQARFNALILLGQLDKVEYNTFTSRPAEPLADAVPVLLASYENAQYPETLRIGALMGITRQCEQGLATAHRKSVADKLVALLKEKAPPGGWSVDGYHWARKLALQAVAGLGMSNAAEVNSSDFVTAIHEIVADDRQPLFLRREGCQALGSLSPSTLTGSSVKADVLLKTVSNFALVISRAGSERDPTVPLDLSKPEDVMPTPTEGTGFVPPGLPQLQASRISPPKKLFAESVTYYLHAVSAVLGGRDQTHGILNAGGVDDGVKKKARELLSNHINPMVVAMNKTPTQLTAKGLIADLQNANGNLQKWMAGAALLATPGAGGTGGGVSGGGAAIQPAPVGLGNGGLAAPVSPRP